MDRVEHAEQRLERLRVLASSERTTLSTALIEAMAITDERYVATFDDDDLYELNYLDDMLLDLCEEYSDAHRRSGRCGYPTAVGDCRRGSVGNSRCHPYARRCERGFV